MTNQVLNSRDLMHQILSFSGFTSRESLKLQKVNRTLHRYVTDYQKMELWKLIPTEIVHALGGRERFQQLPILVIPPPSDLNPRWRKDCRLYQARRDRLTDLLTRGVSPLQGDMPTRLEYARDAKHFLHPEDLPGPLVVAIEGDRPFIACTAEVYHEGRSCNPTEQTVTRVVFTLFKKMSMREGEGWGSSNWDRSLMIGDSDLKKFRKFFNYQRSLSYADGEYIFRDYIDAPGSSNCLTGCFSWFYPCYYGSCFRGNPKIRLAKNN
jgi:hypothetical protein